MKLFLDTAHVETIARYKELGILDGVTTNPSHLSKEKDNPTRIIQKICSLLPEGHISVEITEKDPAKVYEQALRIAALAENIWVKIPCHQQYYAVISSLVAKNIKINCTLVFSLIQSLMMCKLGVFYISPFVGRLNDMDIKGAEILYEIRAMIDTYGYQTQILAASLRDISDVHQAINAGSDAITVPPALLETMLTHPLTDAGMEKFSLAWNSLGVTIFPEIV